MELSTERLILREYGQQDHAAVHAFASDGVVTRYVEWGPNTVQDSWDFLDACIRAQQAQPRTDYTLAVTEAGGAPFGSVGLTVQDGGQGDLGYVFSPTGWHRGYATEAAAALMVFGFDELGLQRIRATCRPQNTASARVLERIGMSRVDYLERNILIRGMWEDSLVYALRNDDRHRP